MKLLLYISFFIAANSWANFQNELPIDPIVTKVDNDKNLMIYPMPVHGDAFRISGINTLKIISIEVYDFTGRIVGQIDKERIDENGEISVEHFTEGTYILSIIFGDHTIRRKIIIE